MTDLTNETLSGTWPYRPRFFEHDAVRLHYVDGDEAEQIVSLIQEFLKRNP